MICLHTNMDSLFPSKTQVDEAIASLADAGRSYSDAPDLAGHASRVEIITRAKKLIRDLVSPDMMPPLINKCVFFKSYIVG